MLRYLEKEFQTDYFVFQKINKKREKLSVVSGVSNKKKFNFINKTTEKSNTFY